MYKKEKIGIVIKNSFPEMKMKTATLKSRAEGILYKISFVLNDDPYTLHSVLKIFDSHDPKYHTKSISRSQENSGKNLR